MTPLAWVGVGLVLAAVALVVMAGWTLLGDASPRRGPGPTRDGAPARLRSDPATPPAQLPRPPRVSRAPAHAAQDPDILRVRADRADRWSLARAAGLGEAEAWREVAPFEDDAAPGLGGADALRVSALEAFEDALPGEIARRTAWIVACGMLTAALVLLLPSLARLDPP